MNSVIKKCVVAALIALGSGSAHAGTVCYIYLTAPCLAAPIAPLQFFGDWDAMANLDAGRCIERAQEYKGWCGTPGLEAYSIFQVDGLNRIGAVTAADGKSYIIDGNGRNTGFHK